MPWLFYNLSTVLFKRSMKGYILRMIGYGVVIAVVCAVTYFACTIVTLGGIPGLILKALLCTLVSNLLFLLMFFKSAEFRDTIQIVKRVIKR